MNCVTKGAPSAGEKNHFAWIVQHSLRNTLFLFSPLEKNHIRNLEGAFLSARVLKQLDIFKGWLVLPFDV